MAHLEITKIVLVHSNISDINYQHDSRVLYTFVPNESFGRLLHISPKNFTFLKTFQSFHILKYGLLIEIPNY